MMLNIVALNISGRNQKLFGASRWFAEHGITAFAGESQSGLGLYMVGQETTAQRSDVFQH